MYHGYIARVPAVAVEEFLQKRVPPRVIPVLADFWKVIRYANPDVDIFGEDPGYAAFSTAGTTYYIMCGSYGRAQEGATYAIIARHCKEEALTPAGGFAAEASEARRYGADPCIMISEGATVLDQMRLFRSSQPTNLA